MELRNQNYYKFDTFYPQCEEVSDADWEELDTVTDEFDSDTSSLKVHHFNTKLDNCSIKNKGKIRPDHHTKFVEDLTILHLRQKDYKEQTLNEKKDLRSLQSFTNGMWKWGKPTNAFKDLNTSKNFVKNHHCWWETKDNSLFNWGSTRDDISFLLRKLKDYKSRSSSTNTNDINLENSSHGLEVLPEESTFELQKKRDDNNSIDFITMKNIPKADENE